MDMIVKLYVMLILVFAEPIYLTMSVNSIVASSKEAFYAWQYKSSKKLTTLDFQASSSKHGKKDGGERFLF